MDFVIFRRLVALVAAFAVLLLAVSAAAEPVRFTAPVTCTAGDASIDLDPGRYLPEQTWQDLDDEMRRLQNQETRLKAENKELRKTDSAPWAVIVSGVLVGFAAAYAVQNR